ncbi:MAG: carbamoyltransferase HypF [Candidatus Krumholzibacteriia bacterium]
MDRRHGAGEAPPAVTPGAGALRIHVSGVVQAVGFRPWVWSEATRLGLAGRVRNSSSGVEIAIEGDAAALAAFLAALRAGGPPLARIDSLAVEEAAVRGFTGFAILASLPEPGASLPVAPDLALCADCLRELRDPADRRHDYPFINCTRCGPRFTIVRDIPYDRPLTTMAGFPLCADCAREYADPADRRFHAQPVACPACGPRLWLEEAGAPAVAGADALRRARALLRAGSVVAVKGIGGWHLACDALSSAAVARLRARKRRAEKPLALMAADAATIARHAEVPAAARALLESPAHPVVLLSPRPDAAVAPEVAPGRDRLGFMLAYAPLHHLLLDPGDVLVMTSGNLSEEPIAHEDDDARRRLAPLADALLGHDRPIHVRCDDSVAAVWRDAPYLFRRARGYAPLPVALPFDVPPLLAAGAELKNTFCLGRDRRAYPSHHIGDLADWETLQSYEAAVAHYERLFRVAPEAFAHDLHPDYQATRYAAARAAAAGRPAIAVQHHHAHIAACLADNGCDGAEPVIGVAFDGAGLGDDGAVWGGEFLVADYAGYRRAAHLAYVPLPGGDAAARHPWRVALSWLRQTGLPWDPGLPPVAAATPAELAALEAQLRAGLNTPATSSLGRLFDAVASLAGIRHHAGHEAQAACELETVARRVGAAANGETAYVFDHTDDRIDPAPVIRAVARDVAAGRPAAVTAARFHLAVADLVRDVCLRLRRETGLQRVALGGGVWQNLLLLELAVTRLEAAGFAVLTHRAVPANDGGLALGQLAIAAWALGARPRAAD